METERIASIIESILFAAERSVSIARFQEVFGEEGPNEDEIKQGLGVLQERTQNPIYGYELREAHGGYHFVTKAQNAEWVQKFLQTKPFRLGRSALEVLAIIAYRQPLTRAEMDQVRGIDSSHLLRTLMERGLVKMTGKAEVPGRPVQYGTTPKFLETVGLNSLSELPPLTELEQLQGDTQDPIKSLQEGLERLVQEEPEAMAAVAEEDQKGLEELSTLIDSARQGSKEIYSSPAHAEVAESNEQAANSLQQHHRPRRKKAQAAAQQPEETTMTSEGSSSEEPLPEVPLIEPPPDSENLLN